MIMVDENFYKAQGITQQRPLILPDRWPFPFQKNMKTQTIMKKIKHLFVSF